MYNGRVYWITGLSNAGKTTIGNALYYELRQEIDNVVLLDGDIMKRIASGSDKAGYEKADRLTRARRYSLMAKLLADQGICVIVCAIAMFDEIRDWNRKNIKGYVEVFLDVPFEILKKRDKKGLFKVDEFVQYPKSPDLILKNDGTVSIRTIVRQIRDIIPSNRDDYDRDKDYWNRYYASIANNEIKPSDFAMKINSRLPQEAHIMELGCGNGRDSLFFLRNGHNVIAIDGSKTAIDILNEVTKDNSNALFVCDDFVKCHALYQMQYDCVYSRFTLHAINEEQENELLNNVKDAICMGGIFCIEARTIHDEIYGMGELVAHNAYMYNDHFRRFIDVDEFKSKLENMGFVVEYIEEAQGFSKTDDSDPVLMRCIARYN